MRRAFASEAVLPWLPGSLEYLSLEIFKSRKKRKAYLQKNTDLIGRKQVLQEPDVTKSLGRLSTIFVVMS